MPEANHGVVLPQLARAAIQARLGLAPPTTLSDPPDWLQQPGATFVTLMHQGRLRGCIGSLEAHRSLLDDIQANALAAAFRDPRFPPLTAEEFADTQVEVSLLSDRQPLTFSSEADALSQLRPGIDGVLLEYGPRRGTFLPQVWEQLPQPRDFLAQLKVKAGLSANFWADDIRLSRYTVEKWKGAA
jgi:AmmeMemoRadiSam system protein A